MKKSIKDSYQLYEESAKADVVVRKDYLTLTAMYNKFLIDLVLEGKEVTLPSRLGTLQIVGRKQKVRFDEEGNVMGLAPDWVKTKELWDRDPEAKRLKKRVFHLNPHTNNVRYKYLWSKARVMVENKTLYSLRMTRENKRAVTSNIEKGINYVTKN